MLYDSEDHGVAVKQVSRKLVNYRKWVLIVLAFKSQSSCQKSEFRDIYKREYHYQLLFYLCPFRCNLINHFIALSHRCRGHDHSLLNLSFANWIWNFRYTEIFAKSVTAMDSLYRHICLLCQHLALVLFLFAEVLKWNWKHIVWVQMCWLTCIQNTNTNRKPFLAQSVCSCLLSNLTQSGWICQLFEQKMSFRK